MAARDRAPRTRRHRQSVRYLPALMQRPALRRILTIDFFYWVAFATFQTTFSLFVARRFGFGVAKTGYFFAAFGILGAVIQGGLIRPDRETAWRQTDVPLGLGFAIVGLVSAALRIRSRCSRWPSCRSRSASASAIRRCRVLSASSRAGTSRAAFRARRARSRASAGRSDPYGEMPRCNSIGESTPYISAAAFLLLTLCSALDFTSPILSRFPPNCSTGVDNGRASDAIAGESSDVRSSD